MAGIGSIITGGLRGIATGLSARERTRGLLQEGRELAIQAEIEEFNAQVTENDLRAGLMRMLSSNNVAVAASGLAGGGPGAEAALSADFEELGRQTRNVRLDASLKAGALRRGSRAARKAGRVSAITGLAEAGTDTVGGFL